MKSSAHPVSQALVLESINSGDNGLNHEQVLLSIPFELDISRFKLAWLHCIQKHPILLSRLDISSSEIDFSTATNSDEFFSYTQLSLNEGDNLVQTLSKDSDIGSTPGNTSSFRVHVYRTSDSNYYCLWSFHHALLDGNSFPLVLRELATTYNCLSEAPHLEKPSPDESYQTYLSWLSNLNHDNSTAFWTQYLANTDVAPVPQIYDETTNSSKKSRKFYSFELELAPLKTLSEECECRINNIFQAAWGLLLSYYCDTTDVMFGCVRACRGGTIENAWESIGMFMNNIPLRIQLDSHQTVKELLITLRQQQVALRPHENTPLAQIAHAANLRVNKLLGTLLMYTEQPISEALHGIDNWEKCTIELFERSSFPLELIVNCGKSIDIRIEGIASKYSTATLQSMATSLQLIIKQFIQSSSNEIASVNILPVSEVTKLTAGFSKPNPATNQSSLIRSITKNFYRDSHVLCLVDGTQQYTYERVQIESTCLALTLQQHGLKKGDVVAISLGRSAKSIVSQLSILRAGGTFLNINEADPTERKRYILNDSSAKFYIDIDLPDENFLPNSCTFIEYEKSLDTAPSVFKDAPASNRDLAYIIYTSGTTGRPKGVTINHDNINNHYYAMKDCLGITKDDVVLQFASHTFDVAIEEIFLALARSAKLIIRDEFCISSTKLFFEFIDKHSISIINIPTAYWHQLIERAGGMEWPHSLRLLIVGGEEISTSALRKWRRQKTRHIRWINGYGPTETTITSTVFEDKEPENTQLTNAVPIGKPIDGVTHYILDSKLRPTPKGCAGQLFIGGLGVSPGYLNRKELNSQKFVANPYLPSTQMYASGDKAYLRADGNYVYLGRIDKQVKVRGFRVELGGIESVCLSHPKVSGCIVEKDVDNDSLTAYVIATDTTVAKEIIPFIQTRLPPYSVPSKVKLVDSIPLTSSGKLDRSSLDNLKVLNETENVEAIAPRDEIESKLLNIWNEHLPESVTGINQSFFEIGGHSLLAVQMFADVEDTFDISPDIRGFFGEPTIEWLATHIRHTSDEQTSVYAPEEPEAASIITLQDEGDGIPIYCICGIEIYRALAMSLGSHQPVYGVFLPVEADMIDQFSNGNTFHLPSVAEMAEAYINAIIQHNQGGPIGLLGVSFGGLLAYEIAQQLSKSNRTVAHLSLLESFLPRANQQMGRLDWAFARIKRYTRNPDILLKSLPNLSKKIFKNKKSLKLKSMDDIANLGFGEFRWQAYHHAAHLYDSEVKPYDGAVTLFRAEEQPSTEGYFIDSTYGWANLVKGGLEIFSVPGDHLGVLKRPNVGILARKLLPKVQLANKKYQST